MDFKDRFLEKQSEKLLPFFVKKKISPEFLTIFRIIFGIITSIFLVFGSYIQMIIILTLYQFIMLLDHIDGPLARKLNRFSLSWVKVDRFFHYFISSLFILFLSLNFDLYLLYLGIFISLLILIFGLFDLRFKKISKNNKPEKRNSFYSWIGIDNSFSIFYFLILFNLKKICLILYSFIYLIILIKKIRK